jgi:hypothetical protein
MPTIIKLMGGYLDGKVIRTDEIDGSDQDLAVKALFAISDVPCGTKRVAKLGIRIEIVTLECRRHSYELVKYSHVNGIRTAVFKSSSISHPFKKRKKREDEGETPEES